jgi:hypothetical protein
MTKTITLRITATETRPMPADRPGDFAGFRYRLTAPSGASADSETTTETFWMFGDAAPGVYVASVAAVDASGNVLADPVTVEVFVGDGPALRTFLAPLGLAYEVA